VVVGRGREAGRVGEGFARLAGFGVVSATVSTRVLKVSGWPGAKPS
jgi:hypothetical protein